MVALVTGANGFLGRYIVTRLRAEGWRVASAGRPEIDIPSAAFEELVESTRPTVLVHCAGPASVPASVANPAADRAGSVETFRSVLQVLSTRAHATRVVLISSAAVYGQPAVLPVNEDTALAPASPYGEHRVECEQLARDHSDRHGVAAVALRVFSAYGEGLSRQVLWDICTQAIREGEVRLLGTGEESRDFVHASDVAAAVEVAAREGSRELFALNVGTGVETTIAELAQLLVEELGEGIPVDFTGERRSGDPLRWRADIARLEALGAEPVTRLTDGARAYAAWAQAILAG